MVLISPSRQPKMKTEEAPKGRIQAEGWAARDPSGFLSPFRFSRRKTGAQDVTVKILYCGICHSDLCHCRNEWGITIYPLVPGHEIVGVVVEVGSEVKKFSEGERVGIGGVLNSCRECETCRRGLQQYCSKIVIPHNSFDTDGSPTYGGFSNLIVCNSKYVVKIPENLASDEAAPLLCAGITVYSPIKHLATTEPGKNLGVVGLGGLGHMAVKFGKAFGLRVTVISTSPEKEKECREILGADEFLVSKDQNQMGNAATSLDFILDTVSADHDIKPLLDLLKACGKLIILGIPTKPLEVPALPLVFGGKWVGGSLIGGMEETQEMMDFCGKHSISCLIEKISPDYLNTAMQRLSKGDVRYRFVLDTQGSFGKRSEAVA
eukprot:TRINITY_DN971_c0_g1_i5.p1 TRINITY_DN971_c0_g1~~TRINITY_DN971_c0_g1_i5.p1  ORF type:complete len:377 (+),score=27.60 TRINITY_DN971_c0_g1_i5:153-1283(+)